MRKMKAGIIGTGNIARVHHIPAWKENNNVELEAVCDNREDIDEIAENFDIPYVFKDYKELLDMNLDIIDVCTPNYLHSIIAVEALEKGKHVFCEKPDAISVKEVLKMKKASEENDRMLMVMRNNRFIPSSKFLKEYIKQGNFGDIYAAKCGWVRRRGIPGKGGWFTTKELSGGGPLIDLGVHMIDLTVWLMGNPTPVSVSGSTWCNFAENTSEMDLGSSTFKVADDKGVFDVEDMATGYIRFKNGATLQIEVSWASNVEKEDRYVELYGTKCGSKWYVKDPEGLKLFGEINGVAADIKPRFPKRRNAKSAHRKNIDHFVDCLVYDTEPVFTPQQGVDMIKILEAIYKSAETGKEVIL